MALAWLPQGHMCWAEGIVVFERPEDGASWAEGIVVFERPEDGASIISVGWSCCWPGQR